MKPFVPPKLPLDEQALDLTSIINILIDANTNVGKYQILLKNSKISPNILMRPLLMQEALQSTKIEGTQATLDEVFEAEMDSESSSSDVREVLNYFHALREGEEFLKDWPISTRLFKRLHRTLLEGDVRGRNRNPGEYRIIQNFIGPNGCSMETASFIPPEPQLVNEYMSNLETYINDPKDNLNPLVRIAIVHAQFETIHPFLDGNGRIGRILLPLYLYNQKLIDSPYFFISEALEKDKHKYYKLLNGTRVRGNWIQWIEFFLESVNSQAKKTLEIINNINNLYEKDLYKVMEIVSNSNIKLLFDKMFESPVFTIKQITESCNISDATCRRYVNQLEKNDIIFSNDSRRNKKYFYYNLLNLLR